MKQWNNKNKRFVSLELFFDNCYDFTVSVVPRAQSLTLIDRQKNKKCEAPDKEAGEIQ